MHTHRGSACSCFVSGKPSAAPVEYHDVGSLSPAVRAAALQAAASVEDGLAKLGAGWAHDDIMADAHAAAGRSSRRGSAGRRRSTWRGRASAAAAGAEAATALLLQNLESLFGVRGGAALQIVEELQGVAVLGAGAGGVAAAPPEDVLEVGPHWPCLSCLAFLALPF